MPSLEKPCLLLPHGCERSTVYVCVPVDLRLASRSPVIETLMEFEGLVELPEGVSLDDFEDWSAIVVQEPSDVTFEELSTALQVGDRLSAQNTAELAAAFAARLTARSWTCSNDTEPLLHAFLTLSKNMQQLVCRKLGTISAPELFNWPLPLQQACHFAIRKGHTPASVLGFLELLSRTDPSLPGLTSLSLECPIPTPAAASLLSSALLHHPALERLHTRRLSWAPCGLSTPAAMVYRTLPQLTAITSLTLSAPSLPHSQLTPAVSEAAREAVQAMAAAISALPSLAQFTLHSTPSAVQHTSAAVTTAPPHKRPRIAACMGPSGTSATLASLDPVIAALSTAPALTALTFYLPAHDSGTPLPCSGVRGPFRTLQQLVYDCGDGSDGAGPEAAARAVPAPLLHAEGLPALRLLAYADLSTCPGRAELQAFVATAARLKDIQHISVYLGPDPDGRRHMHWEYALLIDPHSKAWHIDISTGLPHPVVRALMHGLASSQCREKVSISWSEECMSELLEAEEGVTPFLQPLCAMSQLTCLELSWPKDCSHPRVKDLCSSLFAIPLGSLTQLNELCLRMPIAGALPAAELAQQLATLTQLQSLSLRGLEHSCVEDFRACIAPFTALTFLCVDVRPVTAALVRCFAQCVAGMPFINETALLSCDGPQFNGVASCQCYASADWIQGLLDLPCRGYHEFGCENNGIPESVVEGVRQQLMERGAYVGEELEVIDLRTYDN